MKRIGLNLAVAFVTFCVGAGASTLRNRWASYPQKPKSIIVTAQIAAEPLKITIEMHACGPRANYHTFHLSDGTSISTSCEGQSSRLAAARALQAKPLGNTGIIERAPNLDEKGRRVGDKIIARADGVIELETYGYTLCSTYAASLEHLQWFERR